MSSAREHTVAAVTLSPPSGRCDGLRITARVDERGASVRLDALSGAAPLSYQVLRDPRTLEALAAALTRAAAWLRAVGRR